MKTLRNYLTRQVLVSLLMTVAVFTFVLLLGNVLKQIFELLISGQARIGVVAEAIALLIPFIWGFALPMGLLTATLLVFGRFSADQELTAARASGISLVSLAWPVLVLSLFCCGVSAWINMIVGPQSRIAYVKLLFEVRNDLGNLQVPEGQFIRDFPGYTFYVEKNNKGALENITILKLENETNVLATVTAPSGNIDVNTTNKQMYLHLKQARIVDKNGGTTSVSDFLSPNLYPTNNLSDKIFIPKITDMTFWQLRHELASLEQMSALPVLAATNAPEVLKQFRAFSAQRESLIEPVRIAMHRQLAFSFACFGFALIGIPLGIRVHRRETNIGLAIALVLVFVYYSFVLLADALSAHPEFVPHLIVWVPNFIFIGVGSVLLWRANRGI